jgi:DNA (cytosine-5)-methyltransferase 1
MTHIDLFSGIGGFAYAAQQVWPDYHNLFFCDNNKFCQAVLRKNFGQDILIYNDIREVTVERFIANTESGGLPESGESWRGWDGSSDSVDLLTGGFPCQPFSVAGKREGRDDDRHLWPEMFRVIRDFKPTWIIAENVRGLLTIEGGMAFEQVCLDLESIGYTVQAFVIPACAVNAPHRRDRVWIVANNISRRCDKDGECGGVEAIFGKRKNHPMPTPQPDRHAADADGGRLEGREGECHSSMRHSRGENEAWKQNWLEVATRLCRVDDGLPAILDGLKLSKSKHREERLKALGNAIVPQVAIEIMKAIRESA